MNPYRARQILREHGIRPRKRLSQSFLTSRKIARFMVDALELTRQDRVYEVGTGLGALTYEAALRGVYTLTCEIDLRIAKIAKKFLPFPNIDIVVADALHIGIPPRTTKVLSNVPYGISSKLLLMLLKEGTYELAVLTLQKEFAERLVAEPGTKKYGRLTVLAKLLAEVEVLRTVPSRAFYPSPEVESTIVKIKPKPSPKHVEIERLEETTRILFSQRRRKLVKVLRNKFNASTVDLSPKLLEKRVYQLTPEELLEISRRIS